MPLDYDRTTKTHRRIELLEVSAVSVPSNPTALVQAIGKRLQISPALRRDLGLKDEIKISDLTPIDLALADITPADILDINEG